MALFVICWSVMLSVLGNYAFGGVGYGMDPIEDQTYTNLETAQTDLVTASPTTLTEILASYTESALSLIGVGGIVKTIVVDMTSGLVRPMVRFGLSSTTADTLSKVVLFVNLAAIIQIIRGVSLAGSTA